MSQNKLPSQLDLAIKLRASQHYDKARAILDDLYAEFPHHPQVNYQMAWLCDSQGQEREAVPYYERAIAVGLPDEDLQGALLGLGSTYRCLGQYQKSVKTLREGRQRFPDNPEFGVFLAMTLYNVGQYTEAVGLLLEVIAKHGTHPKIAQYQRAILFYHDKLDQIWE